LNAQQSARTKSKFVSKRVVYILLSSEMSFLRLAAAHVAGVQAGVADGVLLAQPGEETLETEAVAAVRGGAVSGREKLVVGL
jgi:hypothetical protein